MSLVKVTLPGGEIPVNGKQVSFIAPCDCTNVEGLSIEGEVYTVVDAMGQCVTGEGGAFCSGSVVSVILNVEEKKAFIQNPAGFKFGVGDILTTIRTDLGEEWLLCNGAVVPIEGYSVCKLLPTLGAVLYSSSSPAPLYGNNQSAEWARDGDDVFFICRTNYTDYRKYIIKYNLVERTTKVYSISVDDYYGIGRFGDDIVAMSTYKSGSYYYDTFYKYSRSENKWTQISKSNIHNKSNRFGVILHDATTNSFVIPKLDTSTLVIYNPERDEWSTATLPFAANTLKCARQLPNGKVVYVTCTGNSSTGYVFTAHIHSSATTIESEKTSVLSAPSDIGSNPCVNGSIINGELWLCLTKKSSATPLVLHRFTENEEFEEVYTRASFSQVVEDTGMVKAGDYLFFVVGTGTFSIVALNLVTGEITSNVGPTSDAEYCWLPINSEVAIYNGMPFAFKCSPSSSNPFYRCEFGMKLPVLSHDNAYTYIKAKER